MKKTLILGLGNDIISDDIIGLLAVRELKIKLGDDIDVVETSVAGMALLEILIDYDRAIIIDAICSGKQEPGTIIELFPEDLDRLVAPSPHYAGLPEIIEMAHRLQVKFPEELVILAMEIEDVLTIGGEVTERVQAALPNLVDRAMQQIKRWNES